MRRRVLDDWFAITDKFPDVEAMLRAVFLLTAVFFLMLEVLHLNYALSRS